MYEPPLGRFFNSIEFYSGVQLISLRSPLKSSLSFVAFIVSPFVLHEDWVPNECTFPFDTHIYIFFLFIYIYIHFRSMYVRFYWRIFTTSYFPLTCRHGRVIYGQFLNSPQPCPWWQLLINFFFFSYLLVFSGVRNWRETLCNDFLIFDEFFRARINIFYEFLFIFLMKNQITIFIIIINNQ